MSKVYTSCPVEYTASIISNKWKVLILRDLLTGVKRYNELTRSVAGISPKVEYSLSDKGQELKDVLKTMEIFGIKYKEKK